MPCQGLLRLGLLVLITAALAGCNRRSVGSSSASAAGLGQTPSPTQSGSAESKKHYDSIQKQQVDQVMTDETRSEAQVVAILGEPTERSETRHFTNRHGTFEEYDLIWRKTDGEIAVKVTFLNDRKTTVVSTIVR